VTGYYVGTCQITILPDGSTSEPVFGDTYFWAHGTYQNEEIMFRFVLSKDDDNLTGTVTFQGDSDSVAGTYWMNSGVFTAFFGEWQGNECWMFGTY